MIELDSVTFKNFMSYGDYQTTIELSNLGQCLIVGEIQEELESPYAEDINKNRSNGAGKSCIPNAILWCLFGKTMHSASPGDKVVNYYSGKDCAVTVKFKNGDSVTRTRNTDGKNELIYVKDGDENQTIGATLSTARNQQSELERAFNLDWELFCGSVFFTQYGRPWLEMADNTRKKAIERTLHVDRFSYYAAIAKDKCAVIDNDSIVNNKKLEIINNNIQSFELEILKIKESTESYEDKRKQRIDSCNDLIKQEILSRDSINLLDLDKLQKRWDLIAKISDKINILQEQVNSKIAELSAIAAEAGVINSKIELWEEKSGNVCMECEQEIPHSHTNDKIVVLRQQLNDYNLNIKSVNVEIDKFKKTISNAQELLENKKPDTNMIEAKSLHDQYERHDKEINRLKKQLEDIQSEDNPHTSTINSMQEQINNLKEEKKEIKKDMGRNAILYSHYNYIYRVYNDRNKIKSHVFEEHIPYINDRLKHYLGVFGLDIQISLTKSLSVSSNMWGYEFQSGGERKRTDVAFMLAMFDLHEQMYGRQCNVLVLDEVDGRMDDDGIESLINIIKNDLSSRIESILIISHRNMMQDVFPKELLVKRSNRFSVVESI
jgi:DNA repair exonuclease SbcCD ATPase subunit